MIRYPPAPVSLVQAHTQNTRNLVCQNPKNPEPRTIEAKYHTLPQIAMSATAGARSFLRSTSAAARMASAPKPRSNPAFSPFRISKQNPFSPRIFRSAVEMSCCVETMLPYHTATSSALLNSMLSVSRRSYGWTPEDCNDDL